MAVYNFFCETCDQVFDGHFKIGTRPDKIPCPGGCGQEAEYRISAPMVMKASYPDGHKRKGWADLKAAAKLNIEAAGAKKETAAEIKQEIKKMGVKLE